MKDYRFGIIIGYSNINTFIVLPGTVLYFYNKLTKKVYSTAIKFRLTITSHDTGARYATRKFIVG